MLFYNASSQQEYSASLSVHVILVAYICYLVDEYCTSMPKNSRK